MVDLAVQKNVQPWVNSAVAVAKPIADCGDN